MLKIHVNIHKLNFTGTQLYSFFRDYGYVCHAVPKLSSHDRECIASEFKLLTTSTFPLKMEFVNT